MKCKTVGFVVTLLFLLIVSRQVQASVPAEEVYYKPLMQVTVGGHNYSLVTQKNPQESWVTVNITRDGVPSDYWMTLDETIDPISFIYIYPEKTNVYYYEIGFVYDGNKDGEYDMLGDKYALRSCWLVHESEWDVEDYTEYTYDYPSGLMPLGSVYIVIPAYDGFSDTTPVQSISFVYHVPAPASGKISDLVVRITGGVEGTGQVIDQKAEIQSDGSIYGSGRITRELNIGENNIRVEVKSDNRIYHATRIINRLQGQVDEDGDGIDDRTGFPVWPDEPNDWGGDGATDGPPPLPGENATIFDYIKWFADSVLYSMGLLVTTIKGFMGGLGQISRMFGEIFVWIPKELIAIMILGLCMTVILRVVGR